MNLFTFWLVLLLSIVPAAVAQLFGGSCEDPNSCASHGNCIDGPVENTFWCRCFKGFGGDFCEQKCELQCNDGQKCVMDRNMQPKCVCQGNNCFNLLNNSTKNPCSENPCNNGACLPFNGGFQCICHNGYGGSYCEEGRDHCVSNQCHKGSECINIPDGYFCSCPPGRTGQYCEKIDCQQTPGICNKGRCIQNPFDDKSFECHCEEGFEGELCNKDKDECQQENLCNNSGTCVNLPGGFRCDCEPGFSGKYCSDIVNRCEFIDCKNNGTCLHTSRREPVCMCRDGFVGRRCEKACPPGFTGVRCDLRRDQPVCSRTHGACSNGGKCYNGFCTCPPNYLGNNCELRREEASLNTCESDPCMNNASCVSVDAEIGYVCFCPPGFDGDICEIPADVCSNRPCANGGRCLKRGNSFTCSCPSGFYGNRCEKKIEFSCSTNPCKNNGKCSTSGRISKCNCPYGFTGPVCEERIHFIEPKETLIRKICEHRNCSKLSGNGVCDEKCNQAACDFDGGDCSGGQQPFSKCKYGIKCADVFANGVCDQECNSEECLYDGMDCMSEVTRCPLRIRDHCAARFANKVCDPECNTEGCGFDGGDCANRTEAFILSDIRIKIQMDPSEFAKSGGDTLMKIGSALRVAVRIQQDEVGPLVFEWDGEQELNRLELDVTRLVEQRVLSTRIRKSRSASLYTIRGVVLYLEVEEVCQNECRFTTAQSVVDMIAAGLTKTNGRMSLGLPITEAMVAAPRRSAGDGWTTNQIILVAVIAFLAFGTVVAGVIVKTSEPERSRKRKIITAPVWMPPMDPSVEKNRRNQSTHSSQRSLLDANEYLGAKRHCGEHGTENAGEYQQIYPQASTSGYSEPFRTVPEVFNMPQGAIELPVVEIPLHMQAEGSGPIFAELTRESVNQIDSMYKRRVLHWLAANTKGMPEDMITSETVRCIKAGADVNARDCDDNTALMLAVKARRVRLAVVLMREGADPTIFNKSERSALHEAAANKDLRMMTNLLTDKRLLKEIDELDRTGMTALMHVARCEGDYQVEMAELLIKKGAKIDADGSARKDSEIYRGRTALHYAAFVDNLRMVQFLVGRNAYKDKQDEAGRTPIMLAAKEGHERTVTYLVNEGASLTIVDAMEKTAAQLAQASYHHAIAEYLNKALIERNRNESARRNAPLYSHSGHPSVKTGRQTFKAVKRAGSRKTSAPSTSSRESNHLTPPPSDGSFSSPSPLYFQTTSSTPTAMESSPEYGFHQQDMKNVNPMWYPSQSPYVDPTTYHQPMPPNPIYGHPEQMNNSFYC